jgi:hypothetical protein
MKRILLLAAVSLCACALRDARITAAVACTSNKQCDPMDVCFLGQCRRGSNNLAIVSAEVRPPNDLSQLAQLQQGAIDLRKTVLQDFALQPPISVAGQVMQEQESGPPTGVVAVIVFTDRQPPIPDRVTRVIARSDASGNYNTRLPAGSWDVQVQPPEPQPPQRGPPLSGSPGPATTVVNLTLSKRSSLLQINGTLSSDAGPLSGARVSASDSSGAALSAPTLSVDGGFSLLLPAGTPQYYLHVGPPTDLDGGVPANDPLPNYDDLAPLSTTSPAVAVTLTAHATLQGYVKDAAGVGIAGARVYARTNNTPLWSLQRATTADATGAYSLALREGPYVVEAAPSSDPNTPGVSGEQLVQVSAPSTTKDLVCPPKARAFGLVVKPNGSAASAGFQVTATRLPDRLLTTRTAWVGSDAAHPGATDAAGLYHLIGDSGAYRVEVVPPVETGLPRKLVQLDLSLAGGVETVLPIIQISPPLEVVGTVHGAALGARDAPVPGTTVDFFAPDASGLLTIFLGTGLTDAQGRYKAILPDVAHPGAF